MELALQNQTPDFSHLGRWFATPVLSSYPLMSGVTNRISIKARPPASENQSTEKKQASHKIDQQFIIQHGRKT